MAQTVIDPKQTEFTRPQINQLVNLGLVESRKADLDRLFHYAKTYKLDPFSMEVVMVLRHGTPYVQTTIDGYRKVVAALAYSAGTTAEVIDTVYEDFHGNRFYLWPPEQEGPEAGDLSVAPGAVFVTVLVAQGQHVGIAAYNEYVAVNEDGTIADRWEENPGKWLRNISEALAYRQAFPDELGGLILNEEGRTADMFEPARKGKKDEYGNMRTMAAPVDDGKDPKK